MNTSIVVVGSINVDFVVQTPRFPQPGETVVGFGFNLFPGGKGANQAVAAGRLGAKVSMVGQLGRDPHADWLVEHLTASGVNVSGVCRHDLVPSGTAMIWVDAGGQNEIVVVPGANGAFTPELLEASRDRIESAGLVLLQLEIPMTTVVEAARMAHRAGATVILDPAPPQPIASELLAVVDYITPNEIELAALTGLPQSGTLSRDEALRGARRLVERGARRVIAKLGSEGALLVGREVERLWPAAPVRAVDTTAAGDAFNAGFAVALSRRLPEAEAGRFATAVAAISVTRPGAQPSMPRLREVEEFLAGQTGAQSC